MRTTLTKTRLKKDFPYCFNEFIQHAGDSAPDLLSALDSLLFRFGLGITTKPIYAGNSEKILGHESYIKFYPGNALKTEEKEYQVIQDFRKYKDLRKAKVATYIDGLNLLEDFLGRRIRPEDGSITGY